MYKRWCCLTLEQSHLPNNFWSYKPVATKEAGEPGRGRCSYCSPSKWRLGYVVRQLRTYSEFISSVAQKISSAIGKLLWSSCFSIKSSKLFFFFLINLFGCWPLHLECCRKLIFKDISMLVNLKSILWCWRLVSGHGWHPCNTAFPLLCPQNGGVIAEPSRDGLYRALLLPQHHVVSQEPKPYKWVYWHLNGMGSIRSMVKPVPWLFVVH